MCQNSVPRSHGRVCQSAACGFNALCQRAAAKRAARAISLDTYERMPATAHLSDLRGAIEHASPGQPHR